MNKKYLYLLHIWVFLQKSLITVSSPLTFHQMAQKNFFLFRCEVYACIHASACPYTHALEHGYFINAHMHILDCDFDHVVLFLSNVWLFYS